MQCVRNAPRCRYSDRQDVHRFYLPLLFHLNALILATFLIFLVSAVCKLSEFGFFFFPDRSRPVLLYSMIKEVIHSNTTHHHNHHHPVQEGLGLIPVPCILKMKLVPPSLPRSPYVPSSFWFIL